MKRDPFKCVFCGRDPVPVRKGRIASHLTPGGLKCIGIGWDSTQARAQPRTLCRPEGTHPAPYQRHPRAPHRPGGAAPEP